MSNSQFCIQQRHKEQQRLKRLLIFGFVGSAILHSILAFALPRWSFKSPDRAKEQKEPIELTLVNKPKPIAKPKPAPKKVLTTPEPAPQKPVAPEPVKNNSSPPSDSENSSQASSNSVATPSTNSSNSSSNEDLSESDSSVATNSAPPSPESNSEPSEGISCVSNCEPEYPAALEGVEGSAGIKLTIDSNGNVVGAELADADSNNLVNRQALLAARQMQFSLSSDEAALVQVKIDFTVEGSEYDRARREEQERKEQAAQKERQAQEASRQQQSQQQQEFAPPSPTTDTQSAPKPLPASSEPPSEGKQELDEERLRKFQERMENYREE